MNPIFTPDLEKLNIDDDDHDDDEEDPDDDDDSVMNCCLPRIFPPK